MIFFGRRVVIERLREKRYRTLDAKNHLLYYLGIDSECELDESYAVEIAEDFKREYGIALKDAISEDSKNSLIDSLVSDFFQTQDCNEPENVIWENAIEEELRWLKENRSLSA